MSSNIPYLLYSLNAWSILLRQLLLNVEPDALKSKLISIKPKVARHDELYSARLYREMDADKFDAVNQIVNTYAFQRTPDHVLVDWQNITSIA